MWIWIRDICLHSYSILFIFVPEFEIKYDKTMITIFDSMRIRSEPILTQWDTYTKILHWSQQAIYSEYYSDTGCKEDQKGSRNWWTCGFSLCIWSLSNVVLFKSRWSVFMYFCCELLLINVPINVSLCLLNGSIWAG
jgi:hypothetical protein